MSKLQYTKGLRGLGNGVFACFQPDVMKNFEGKKELNVKLIGRTRIIYDNNQIILSK